MEEENKRLRDRVAQLERELAAMSRCPRCGGSGLPSDFEYNCGVASVCPECGGDGKRKPARKE